jgi:GNAT superfamily N-acetyltransferase
MHRCDHANQVMTPHLAARQSDRMSKPQAITLDTGNQPRVTLRPISTTDETELIELVERCSDETCYLRFGSHKPHLRTDEARHLCDVDDHWRGALVVVEPGDPATIHGVGRWEGIRVTDAELAFVIEDRYQGRGLGRKLLEATIERAREEGFTHLFVDTLQRNYRMHHLARDYGIEIEEL